MSELEGMKQKSKLRRLEGKEVTEGWGGNKMVGRRIGCKWEKNIQKGKSKGSRNSFQGAESIMLKHQKSAGPFTFHPALENELGNEC